jgi:hypothetical protein
METVGTYLSEAATMIGRLFFSLFRSPRVSELRRLRKEAIQNRPAGSTVCRIRHDDLVAVS